MKNVQGEFDLSQHVRLRFFFEFSKVQEFVRKLCHTYFETKEGHLNYKGHFM